MIRQELSFLFIYFSFRVCYFLHVSLTCLLAPTAILSCAHSIASPLRHASASRHCPQKYSALFCVSPYSLSSATHPGSGCLFSKAATASYNNNTPAKSSPFPQDSPGCNYHLCRLARVCDRSTSALPRCPLQNHDFV